jgi:hypothetical protein
MLPFPLQFRMAYDAGLTSDVLRIFLLAGFSSLRRCPRGQRPIFRPQIGSVTFVQRVGNALNLDVHSHALVLDGDYEAEAAAGSGRWSRPPAGVGARPSTRREAARQAPQALLHVERLAECLLQRAAEKRTLNVRPDG